MVRWQPDGRGRLEQAAFALFSERGFENTTVAEIAARAGLTERTFFRHYADKREVLFAGAVDLQERLVDHVLNAASTIPPLESVISALVGWGEMMEEHRVFARQRFAIIDANAELRERELIKLATLAAAIADALGQRGVSPTAATLTAEAGIAVFKVAFERWVADSNRQTLPELIEASSDELKAVTAGAATRDAEA
jgi:AcrR family transcriptional regulator